MISKCELPGSGDASKWAEVKCSNLPKLSGVQDFYLTAEGLGNETLVGNIKFGVAVDTSKVGIRDARRANPASTRSLELKSNFHDLKGRRYDKQIPYRVMF